MGEGSRFGQGELEEAGGMDALHGAGEAGGGVDQVAGVGPGQEGAGDAAGTDGMEPEEVVGGTVAGFGEGGDLVGPEAHAEGSPKGRRAASGMPEKPCP
jgi:hypothetical protein